jgi:hypothetical protein
MMPESVSGGAVSGWVLIYLKTLFSKEFKNRLDHNGDICYYCFAGLTL